MNENELVFEPIEESRAKYFHENFHYLHTARDGRFHFKITTNAGLLLMIATLSRFDLNHLLPNIGVDVRKENLLVLSRLISFEWTPKNIGSQFMSLIFEYLKANSETQIVVTYLDPATSRKGTVYKASNATLIARERRKASYYLDGSPITKRSLLSTFGTTSSTVLRRNFGDRLVIKDDPTLLFIYAWFLTRKGRKQYFDRMDDKDIPIVNSLF